MHRNELKTIAEGFKKSRPPRHDHEPDSEYILALHAESVEQWEKDVTCVADALQLVDKARSNFEAACGLIKPDQG